jgi:tetratricopeptide (TPR) repeat protein
VALVNLGHYYNEQEDYATAITLLERSIKSGETDPEIFNGYQNLGLAYARTGRYDEAVRMYTEAWDHKPGYGDALMGRGLAYTDMQKYDSAVADFTFILKTLNAKDTRALYSRGIAWNRMGLPDSAIADYTAAIAIDPAYSNPYVNRGNIYFTRNRYPEAIADYDNALRLSPDDGSCLMNRSFALFRLGRYREALADAMKAKELKIAVHPNYISDLQKAIR